MRSAAIIARHGNGRIALNRATGLTLQGAPFTQRTPFRVASISKLITAWGFLTLVSENQIRLDEDASTVLRARLRHPAFPALPITPRLLLSHRSGLRNGTDFPVPANERLLDRLIHARDEPGYSGWFGPDTYAPGTWFSYADINYAVLAQLIERITDTRFDVFMRDRLFRPLGLQVGYNWSGMDQARRDAAAPGARFVNNVWTGQVDTAIPPAPTPALYLGENSQPIDPSNLPIGQNGGAFAPHGGLRASVYDLDRLASALAGRSHLPIARLQAAATLLTEPAWAFTPAQPNGDTEGGFFLRFGLGAQLFAGQTANADAFFGPRSANWRGHFGDAYGWLCGLFWNARTGETLAYALNGMPETARPAGTRSALTVTEEAVIDLGLQALA
jgi:CubicO group peptidase (beta-lactamase class C family)